MKFKITPLTIFLLLLIVLVVFIVISNSSFFQREGFVSFLQSESAATKQTVPQYSSNEKVYKVYDNLYFDNNNGSLIELTSTKFTGNVDLIGNTITQMSVLPRNSAQAYTYEFSSPAQKIAPPEKTLVSTYAPLVYETDGVNTDKYSVFYLPWGKKTFLHVLNLSSKPVSNEATYLFSDTSVVYSKMMDGSKIYIGEHTIDYDENNGKDITIPAYNTSRKVHQLNKYVHYDMKNGNIIIAGENDSLDIYKRGDKNKITISKTNNSSGSKTKFGDDDVYKTLSFDVQMYEDKLGRNTVMVFSQAFETMVAIAGKDTNNSITVKYLQRFNPNGIDDGSKMSDNYLYDDDEYDEHDDDDDDDDEIDLNDYMLKTQIVPPVCPACPACPACDFKGACSNCGGNGGSGTLSKKGETTVQGDEVSKKSQNVGDAATGAVGAVGNVASGAVGAVGDVASGAVGAVGNVASGAVGAAGNVASGALGAAGNVASGALGAVGDVASGIIGAGKQVSDAAGSNATTSGQTSSGGAGTNQQLTQVMPQSSTDPYSYYGQLPYKKPSEYMPITADFSSFGK
jgi:hypothetical protein